MKKIRFRYQKGENIKYLSHLDMLKVFDRAARRVNLPVSYTEGFNPRPKFVFGNPLPVGVTSDCEYIDITFNEDVEVSRIIDLLNSTMPKGLKILFGDILSEGSPNIMALVTKAEYIVETDIDIDKGKSIISFYDSGKVLNAEKKSKTKTQTINIRPLIHELELDKETIRIVTDTGNQSNLRPELALKAISETLGFDIVLKTIHRTRLF